MILCLILAPAFAYADTVPPTLELNIGSAITHFKYQELCTPSDSETAMYNSLLAEGKFYLPGYWSFIGARYESASTNSNYQGAFLSNNQPVSSTDKLKFTDYAVTFNLALSENVYLYAGYGRHIWDRFLSGGAGYREIYSWDYTPAGVTAWYWKSAEMEMGVDLGLKPMSHGKINVITSQTIAGGQDSTATLGDKTGYKVALPFIYMLGSFVFKTTPWFEHFEIGESNTITNTTLFQTAPHLGLEPDSETYIWGLDLSLGIRF